LRTELEAFAVLSDLWRSAGAMDRSTRTTDTPFGVLRHVAAPAKLSEAPAYWALPSGPLGVREPDGET